MALDEDVVKQKLFLTFSCYFHETEVRQTVQLCSATGETGRERPARPGPSGGSALSDLNPPTLVLDTPGLLPARLFARLLLKKRLMFGSSRTRREELWFDSLPPCGHSFILLLQRCNFIPRLCEELLIMVRDGCSLGTITASHSITFGGGG